MKTEHFFRPVFTRRFIQRLFAGEVINLVGEPQQGTTRLLEDIRRAEPENIAVIKVDMRVYSQNHHDFLQALSDVIAGGTEIGNFSEVIDAIQMHGGQLFFLLDHFDEILDNPQYEEDFFANLQRIQLIANISLVVVTRKPIEINITRLDDFLDRSQFEPEIVKLPPIGYKRIKEELLRSHPSLKNWTELANPVFGHQKRYEFLEFVTEKIQELPPESRDDAVQHIRSWEAEFNGTPLPSEKPTKQSFLNQISNLLKRNGKA